MGILIGFVIGILVLCALLLIIIILIQDDGSEGAGIIFGSTASQQYGVRKGNIVTRTTGILATVFMVLAFVLAFFLTNNDDAESLQKIADEKQPTQGNTIKWWEEGEKSSIKEVSKGEEDTEQPVDESNESKEDTVSNVSSMDESDDKNPSVSEDPSKNESE